jgi:SNF family Na+-dependent transporter
MGVIGKGSLFRYLGVIGALIPLGVSFYYVFIESWTVAYFLKYVMGGIGIERGASIAAQSATSSEVYTAITGAAQDGSLITAVCPRASRSSAATRCRRWR